MICFKKHHHILTYSFVGLFASFFIAFFASSSSSFASSVTCTASYSVTGSNYSNDLPSSCDFSSLSASTYYYDLDFTFSLNSTTTNNFYFYFEFNPDRDGFASQFASTQAVSLSNPYGVSFSSHTGSYQFSSSFKPKSIHTYISSSWSRSVSFTLVVSDEPPSDCPPCPEAPPCPDPDSPYSEQLNHIITAIYTIGAVLIFLYFMFCLYQIVIKPNRGDR